MVRHKTAIGLATVLVAILLLASVGLLYFFLGLDLSFLPSNPGLHYSVSSGTQTFKFDDYTLKVGKAESYSVFAGCSDSYDTSYSCGKSTYVLDSNGCKVTTNPSASSCTVKCLNYRCTYNTPEGTKTLVRYQEATIKSCETCGSHNYTHGGSDYKKIAGCAMTYELTRNGIVINSSSVPSPSTTRWNLASGGYASMYRLYLGEKVSDGTICESVGGTLGVTLPPGVFNITAQKESSSVIEDTNATFTITVNNGYRAVTADLLIDYEAPTLIGSATKTLNKTVSIAYGDNTYTVSIPTTDVANIVRITPRLDVFLDTSSWSGFNTGPKLNVGTIYGNTSEFQITPRPLYLKEPCQAGYAPSQSAPGWCIRSDVREFTCYQLGCPQFEGSQDIKYECTTAGICAQTIFKTLKCTTDAECGTGFKCDAGSGTCFQEKIYTDIFQCTSTTDCARPCEGIQIACTNNKCEYSGECNVQEVPVIVKELADQTSVFTPTDTSPVRIPEAAWGISSIILIICIIAFPEVIFIGFWLFRRRKR